MVVEKLPEINPTSGRVTTQVRLAISILGSRQRQNTGEYYGKRCLPKVLRMGGKYRPKGGTRVGVLLPGVRLARPGVGSRHLAAWEGVAPLWLSFRFRESSETMIFFIYILEFFWHCKYGYKTAIH